MVDGPPVFSSNRGTPSSEKTEDSVNKLCDDRGDMMTKSSRRWTR